MAPPLVRHLEGGIMGGVCVTIMEVRYDNMEGGLMIGCSKGEKVEEGSATSPSHLTFQSSEVAPTGHGLCDHR